MTEHYGAEQQAKNAPQAAPDGLQGSGLCHSTDSGPATQAPARPKLQRITGLWRERDRHGRAFFVGFENGARRFYIFENTRRESPFDCEFVLYRIPDAADPMG